jgi:predicted DNA-binding transcriptional regulator AlpA
VARKRSKNIDPIPAPAPAPPDRLLTTMELATKWGRTRSWVMRRVYAKEIPHIRMGKRNDVYFRESVVDAWLESQEIPAKGAPRRSVESLDQAAETARWYREFGMDPDENPFL